LNVICSDQPLRFEGHSLFLAGPTPREATVASWRPEANSVLRELGYPGTVLVPERRDWSARFDYLDQVEWEFAALERASVITFWVPRDLEKLPGLTTNVEFGRYVGSGRVLYGRPSGASHTCYLDWLYKKLTGRGAFEDLRKLFEAAAALQAGPITNTEPARSASEE
jgi:Nucleoside 2-deoxyribosyltransferase like